MDMTFEPLLFQEISGGNYVGVHPSKAPSERPLENSFEMAMEHYHRAGPLKI